jgi:hypothetical protein
MKVVITQPNFLPWLGYLAQMASCDVFVCLDSVQFTRREWQNRNRIVSRQGKVDFLTVNVRKGPRHSTILDTFIAADYQPRDLQAQIAAYYHGCPRAREGGELCYSLYAAYHLPGASLADANEDHLIHLGRLMDLSTRVERASILEEGLQWTTPTERLLAICQSLGATTYLSSPGARPYMESELHKFAAAGIDVQWQEFAHTPYVDGRPFVTHLSCVDFLHHRPVDELLPYVLACNRFVAEADFASRSDCP